MRNPHYHKGVALAFCSGYKGDEEFDFATAHDKTPRRLRVRSGVLSLIAGDPVPHDVAECYKSYLQARRDEYEARRTIEIAKDPANAQFWLPFDEA